MSTDALTMNPAAGLSDAPAHTSAVRHIITIAQRELTS